MEKRVLYNSKEHSSEFEVIQMTYSKVCYGKT